jgi:hypothetical protein
VNSLPGPRALPAGGSRRGPSPWEAHSARPGGAGRERIPGAAAGGCGSRAGAPSLRYTSPHPRHITPSLIQAHRDLPALAHHVHLPVPVRSDAGLRRMVRRYSRRRVRGALAALREAVPHHLQHRHHRRLPREREEDSPRRRALLARQRFVGLFGFKYSPRPVHRGARLETTFRRRRRAPAWAVFALSDEGTASATPGIPGGHTVAVLVERGERGDSPARNGPQRDRALRRATPHRRGVCGRIRRPSRNSSRSPHGPARAAPFGPTGGDSRTPRPRHGRARARMTVVPPSASCCPRIAPSRLRRRRRDSDREVTWRRTRAIWYGCVLRVTWGISGRRPLERPGPVPLPHERTTTRCRDREEVTPSGHQVPHPRARIEDGALIGRGRCCWTTWWSEPRPSRGRTLRLHGRWASPHARVSRPPGAGRPRSPPRRVGAGRETALRYARPGAAARPGPSPGARSAAADEVY